MINTEKLRELLIKMNIDFEIAFIGNGFVFDSIRGCFIDNKTGNIVINLEQYKRKK